MWRSADIVLFDKTTVYGGPESDLFKFAFLDFERVGANYSIASALHETYVADVDKILKRLEVQKSSFFVCF
jgi:hypothetical protein